jgi:Tfp pilus assembly protein PilF
MTPWGAVLAVFVVSIALYIGTLGHDFVYDDRPLIVDNQSVRTLDAAKVKHIFTGDTWRVMGREGGYFRPLVTLSYHVNWWLFDGRPAGFHFVNVMWNAGVCVMVFLFVYVLFGDVLLGLLTALLFAVHPIHSESVAWISGRTDLLASLWSLVSLTCYVLARRRRQPLWYVTALAAFALAMLAKESAACVPLIVALLEIGPFARLVGDDREPSLGSRAAWSIARIALFVVVLVLYVMLRNYATGAVASTYSGFAKGALGLVALPLSILAGYVYKVLLPLRLAAEYDAPIPESFSNPSVIAGFAIVILIVWAAWRFRRRPDVALGTGIFVFGLAPVLNIVPIGEVSAERFLYFPSLGVMLILGSLFASALRTVDRSMPPTSLTRWKITPAAARGLTGILAVILVVFFARTIVRNADWRDERTLFAKTLDQDPDNPRAHAAVAGLAKREGNIRGAIAAYQRSLEINPDYPIALNGLAELYARQGRYEEAEQLLKRALNGLPNAAELVNNLGSVYLETGRSELARKQFERALQINPDEVKAHLNLGLTHLQRSDGNAARPHFERAAAAGNAYYVAYVYLAAIEQAAGNVPLAKEYARKFLSLHGADDRLRRQALAILE